MKHRWDEEKFFIRRAGKQDKTAGTDSRSLAPAFLPF
jgi:hypothetical protein